MDRLRNALRLYKITNIFYSTIHFILMFLSFDWSLLATTLHYIVPMIFFCSIRARLKRRPYG